MRRRGSDFAGLCNIQGLVTIAPATLTLAPGVVLTRPMTGRRPQPSTTGCAGGLVGLVGDQTLSIAYQSAAFVSKNAGPELAAVALRRLGWRQWRQGEQSTTSRRPRPAQSRRTGRRRLQRRRQDYDGSAAATVTTQLNGVIRATAWRSAGPRPCSATERRRTNKTVTMSGLALTAPTRAITSCQPPRFNPRRRFLRGWSTFTEARRRRAARAFGSRTFTSRTPCPATLSASSGTVTLAGIASGVQPIVSVSGASLNDPNYTLTGATGSVLIGAASLALDRVVAGAVAIATSGTTTTVTEHSDTAIIDWLRFSIASNETVDFVQPASTSVVLNRVTGNEAQPDRRRPQRQWPRLPREFQRHPVFRRVVRQCRRPRRDHARHCRRRFRERRSISRLPRRRLDQCVGLDRHGERRAAALAGGGGVTCPGRLRRRAARPSSRRQTIFRCRFESASPGVAGYLLNNLHGVAAIGGVVDVGAERQGRD